MYRFTLIDGWDGHVYSIEIAKNTLQYTGGEQVKTAEDEIYPMGGHAMQDGGAVSEEQL